MKGPLSGSLRLRRSDTTIFNIWRWIRRRTVTCQEQKCIRVVRSEASKFVSSWWHEYSIVSANLLQDEQVMSACEQFVKRYRYCAKPYQMHSNAPSLRHVSSIKCFRHEDHKIQNILPRKCIDPIMPVNNLWSRLMLNRLASVLHSSHARSPWICSLPTSSPIHTWKPLSIRCQPTASHN